MAVVGSIGAHRMRATHIVLASVCALAVTGRALAGCPVADAKIEKAIATKPEFCDAANAQVVRDLRTLRDAAVVLDAYEHEVAWQAGGRRSEHARLQP